MNDTDRKIVNFLRHSGRATVTEISENLGISRATVKARMGKLSEDGEILGYSVVLKSDSQTHAIRGLMMIEIAGMASDAIVRLLSSYAEVLAIHSTNGRWDLIVELGTETLEEFDRLLGLIRKNKEIKSSETSLLLSTKKQNTIIQDGKL